MKLFITILFIACFSTISSAQDTRATMGKFTDCLRPGGICSFGSNDVNTNSSENKNATFIKTQDGKTILRIYRDHITKEEEIRLLGSEITQSNINILEFNMVETLPLAENIKVMTSNTISKQLDFITAGNYLTEITQQYIEITIVE